jgi:Protein of unknown function (DUF3072)
MTPALHSAAPTVAPPFSGDTGALLDRLSGPMTRSQALTLKSLAIEAYQPGQFETLLTRAEAARRIQALRDEIALADSF